MPWGWIADIDNEILNKKTNKSTINNIIPRPVYLIRSAEYLVHDIDRLI